MPKSKYGNTFGSLLCFEASENIIMFAKLYTHLSGMELKVIPKVKLNNRYSINLAHLLSWQFISKTKKSSSEKVRFFNMKKNQKQDIKNLTTSLIAYVSLANSFSKQILIPCIYGYTCTCMHWMSITLATYGPYIRA